MAVKDRFSPNEWNTIKETLLLSPMLVMMASPQGAVGLLKENTALYSALNQMLGVGAGYPLIDALRGEIRSFSAQDAPGMRQQRPVDEVRREVLERCRETGRLLHEQVTPEEEDFFRRGLLWVCWQVANAASEQGGLLHRDAPRVTGEEREVLRQVAFAFGLPGNESVVETLPPAPVRAMPASVVEIFSPEEWRVLLQAPLWVGMAVVAAAPGGVFGMIKEIQAMLHAIQAAAVKYPENPLIIALMDDLTLKSGTVMAGGPLQSEKEVERQAIYAQAIDITQQAAMILEAKADPGQAAEFKRLMVGVAELVAEAAKEGGFMGVGGVRVTEAERAVIEEVKRAVKL